MGTFSRLRYVIAANVNAMLEKAENPEKLLRALVREMEEAKDEARTASSEFLAEEATIKRHLAHCQQQIEHWQERAELAVQEDRDDLARAALLTKSENEQQLQELNRQLQESSQSIQQIQTDMESLNQKLAQAKQLQKEFSKKAPPAAAGSPRVKPAASPQERKINRAFNRFERLEAQVDSLEARVRSYDLTPKSEDPWKELEQPLTEQLEAELSALKAKLTKQPVAAVENTG